MDRASLLCPLGILKGRDGAVPGGGFLLDPFPRDEGGLGPENLCLWPMCVCESPSPRLGPRYSELHDWKGTTPSGSMALVNSVLLLVLKFSIKLFSN